MNKRDQTTVSQLTAYFDLVLLPTQPIKISEGETVTDSTLFVKSHFASIKTYQNNMGYLPYLDRLTKLKQAIEVGP